MFGRILGQEGVRHEPAHVGVGALRQADQVLRRGRPAGELPAGELQPKVAERLAALPEEGLDPLEVEEASGDLGAGIDRAIGLGQGDIGMMAADVLDGEPRQRGVGRPGRIRHLPEPLAAGEHGRFVLVSSSQAQAPSGTNAAYGAAKAAAESWTLALADTFREADSAATANILVVNAILTPEMREKNPEKPFKTFTSAEEIADAIAFICSDEARKMNGKRLALHP